MDKKSIKTVQVESNYPVDLAAHGIVGFFVITTNGMPLIERYYPEEQSMVNYHTDLVGTFFSAIAKLVGEIDNRALLSDIGYHTIRVFLDFTPDLIFLLYFDELKLVNMKITTDDVRILLKGTLSSIKSVFQAFFGEEEVRTLANPLKFQRLQTALYKQVQIIDKSLLRAHRDVLSIINPSG